MAITAVKTQPFISIERRREACPENLSKAGKWAMENPNGIAIIVNRRAVNR
jgi:hypothetical protein